MIASSLWLEEKYLNLLSPQLDRFSRRGNAYSCRCSICGDSKKSKFKTRGYFFRIGGRLRYKCHNCGASMTFLGFLKQKDPHLFNEFRMESLREMGQPTPRERRPEPEEPVAEVPEVDVLAGLKPLLSFPEGHPVREYVRRRLIPERAWSLLYYSGRFMEWVNSIVPGKFDDHQLRMDEPRLVIPFVGTDGRILAVTGRSFKKRSIKYLTVKVDESADKVFGMERVDPSRRVYVFEGPIDSLFIGNSIAFAGSSGSVPSFDDSVIVLDNEPRNREIVRLMEKFVSQGHTVCVWPVGMPGKDVNEFVEAGMTTDQVKRVIDDNAVKGLAATVRLSQFKKQ